MIYLNETYSDFHGDGHLTVGDKWRPRVSFKFVLRRDDFCGGSFLFDLNDEDAAIASQLQDVRLAVGGRRFFKLVVGYHGGGPVSAAVTGLKGPRP